MKKMLLSKFLQNSDLPKDIIELFIFKMYCIKMELKDLKKRKISIKNTILWRNKHMYAYREINNRYTRNRYKNDEAYRQKKLQIAKEWYKRKREEKLLLEK